MGLAGFNRARRRLSEEHKKRVEALKIIKKPAKKSIEKVKKVKKIAKVEVEEIKVQPEEAEVDIESEKLPEVTEENKDDIKKFEPENNSEKE